MKGNVMTKVYWRRLCSFPATSVSDIEVTTDAPDGAGEWEEIDVSDSIDIDHALGLCGNLNHPSMVADATVISAAIHRFLGLNPVPWDYECLWRQVDFDSHREDDAEQYFRAMGVVYGAEVEAMARLRYAE